MIKLVFTANREIFTLDIENREIWYKDRLWGRIRFVPKDEAVIKRLQEKKAHNLINLFNLTEEEQLELDRAKSEEELAEVCIKDAQLKGARLLIRK